MPEDSGKRLDVLAAKYFSEFSRAHIQRWVKEGSLLLNNKKIKPRQIVTSGDSITVEVSEEITQKIYQKILIWILFGKMKRF